MYVVGGAAGGTADAFSLATVQTDPPSAPPLQHASSAGGNPIIGVAITPNAADAILLEAMTGDGEISGWTVQVLNIATGAISAPGRTLQGRPQGVAADPVNSSIAYVADSSGQVWSVGLGSNPPAISAAPVAVAAPSGQAVATSTMAISPDGLTAYLGGRLEPVGAEFFDDFIEAVPIQPGGLHGEWTGPSHGTTGVNVAGTFQNMIGTVDLAISPDGSHIYGVDIGTVFGVGLPLPAAGTTLSSSVTSGTVGVNLLADTVSPDGQTVYAGGLTQSSSFGSAVASLAAPAGPLEHVAALPSAVSRDGALSLAVSPDQSTLLATVGGGGGSASAALFPVGLGSAGAMNAPARAMNLTNGTPQSDPSLGPTAGPQAVVVAPDQAPVARIAPPAPVQVGQSATLDASPSTVAYGQVNTFAWTFGDGKTAVTSGPTAFHPYSAPGIYTVTVTETDEAGNSTTTGVPGAAGVDGPGQTPYRLASASATTSTTISVTTTPPSSGTTPTSVGPGSTTPTLPGGGSTTTTPGAPGSPTGTATPGLPSLVLNPGLGPPGTIVTVSGTGFPPDAPVTVSWSVSTGSVVIVADALGNLPPSQLLVLTPDVLGPRLAIASSAPPAIAPFLVVPSDSEPDGGALIRSEGP